MIWRGLAEFGASRLKWFRWRRKLSMPHLICRLDDWRCHRAPIRSDTGLAAIAVLFLVHGCAATAQVSRCRSHSKQEFTS